MIKLKQGDILKQDAEALVNTVNCVGVMGRGIALQFREAFPGNYSAYRDACLRKEVQIGQMFVFDLNRLENPRLIINFPTKRHWKGKSSLVDIQTGLEDLVNILSHHKVRSVAVPPLGCGLGGLDWGTVRPMIEEALSKLPDLQVFLYEPGAVPTPEEIVHRTSVPKMTVGRAALLGLIGRYLAALMDVSVSLLEIHKLMYFLQEAGEPLSLRYNKALYGPYAQNLRHVLGLLEGHFILGYGEGTDTPDKPIELMAGAAPQGEQYLCRHPKTRLRFDRVGELIAGFETPIGLELLSTVHWVVTREGADSPEEATAKTYEWSPRKQMFRPEHIRVAWEILSEKGWLPTDKKKYLNHGHH